MSITPGLKMLVITAVVAAIVAAGLEGMELRAAPQPAVPPAAIVRLTQGPANALRPTWSPDERTIAYESNQDGRYHIYLMAPDLHINHALTSGAQDDRHAAWTPDGKAILYDSERGANQDIWLVNVADGKTRQLTHVDGLAEYAALSPDGRRLAFYVYRDMTLNLWSANADGGDAHALTTDLADARRSEPTMAWQRPGWSADSRQLTYGGGDGKSIWVMNADGSGARQVISDGETNHFPWFLADGRLAYITEYVPPRFDTAFTNAWAYDLRTGESTLLREHMAMQGPVDFSSDLARVVFHSVRAGNGNFDIYLADLHMPGGLAALQGAAAIGGADGSATLPDAPTH